MAAPRTITAHTALSDRGTTSSGDAVRRALTQYVGSSGRARRSVWFFVVFGLLVSAAAAVVDTLLGTTVFGLVAALGLFLP